MSQTPQQDWIQVRQSDGVESVVLNRPPWNVLNTEMMKALARALAEAWATPAHALVLRGEGRGFSAGAAVEDHLPDKVQAMLVSFWQVLRLVRTFPVPTIAVVHGLALGGGLELACAADIIFAADNARFGQPEIRLGAIAPAALVFLPRRIGYHSAADLLLSGREIKAVEAREAGLVDFVCPASELMERVGEYTRTLVSLSGPVLRACKQALLQNDGEGWDHDLKRMERFYLDNVVPEADYVEGLQAFLEKRTPQWRRGGKE